jgi:hypothetical protein
MLKSSNLTYKIWNFAWAPPFGVSCCQKSLSDSEKVMMHFPTEAYISHTCHCESPRDVHPYVGRVVQVTWNRVKLFFGCKWMQSKMLGEVLELSDQVCLLL